ncbi:Calmodulin [Tritrichomonas foetus]|uniref:Calmodulin n=1 Tax=Tritrichomonas foetus TaxID=1144522 RepID=A0A1J4KSG0_9EUKA|nr:Calmodulin [Tritrichomonas foetus]|eukprot:OHT13824.1 Calmodulin [Tritrichomonas foetus]
MCYGLTEQAISEVRQAFKSFDKDEDGYLQCCEVEKALRTLHLNPTSEEIEALLEEGCKAIPPAPLETERKNEEEEELKQPQSGVPFNFFLYAYSRLLRNNDPVRELISGFRSLDKTHCGKLTVADARRVLESTRQPFTERQINDIIEAADPKNGFVDYEVLARILITE